MSSKYIIRSILILVALLALNQIAIAGVTGKIAGTVRDVETGERLPAANVILVGTDLGASCDAEGDYFIINIPPGIYALEARMMGYESVTQTGIRVNTDHTTPVDFELRSTPVEVPSITVVAEAEIIKMDVSSSRIVIESEQIEAVPLVSDLREYINLQAGVRGWEIRGGSVDQTAFMMDGLMLVDNRANQPITSPNLSSIKEFEIIKGGFNPEYGNVRSGVANIITQEGSRESYHGSFEFRFRPAGLKHSKVSVFDPDNFYLRPYLEEEDSVSWLGTDRWPEDVQSQYPEFRGWNAVSEELLADADPTNDRTPQECKERFEWLHTVEGSSALGQKERKYGHKPDWLIDFGIGGPIPLLNKLTFFASYRNNHEMWALPTFSDYFIEENAQLKLTYRMTPRMKWGIVGLYGEINTMSTGDDDDYVTAGNYYSIGTGDSRGTSDTRHSIYYPDGMSPKNVYKSMFGITLNHTLSPKTFYSVRLTHNHIKHFGQGPKRMRDTTTVRYFGSSPMTEAPYGGSWAEQGLSIDPAVFTRGSTEWDWSEVSTLNLKGDLTSQINKYNQVKVGFTYNSDNVHTDTRLARPWFPENASYNDWDKNPIRAGAYIQDKVEFEGMIAIFGLRMDYSNANTEWYTVDRYSPYFGRLYKDEFTEITPTEPAEAWTKFSPRFGISHPIGEASKIFFNYGWFYSMAPAHNLYAVEYGMVEDGVVFIGNPSADLPRTVAYELGFEQNVANLFLLRINGYYKDITAQTGAVAYTDFDGVVNYSTIENNNYADIRGFELNIERRYGGWITGWLNYDYMVTTSGYLGRQHYYQDRRMQAIYGLQNPYQERPLARPIFRANIAFSTPEDFGPGIGGIYPASGWQLSFLYSWESGDHFTWDPLQTFELKDNLQWITYSNWDARLYKNMSLGGVSLALFMDIHNILNTEHFNPLGFYNAQDYQDYMKSLHLPMYKGDEYQEAPDYDYVGGNDQPGDIDKDYIDLPNRDFLTLTDIRYLSIGVRVSF